MNIQTTNILSDSDFDIAPNRDFLTELDRATLDNNYDKVINLLSRGSTIYNSSNEKLCNGIINRKYRQTSHKCIKNICYKY